MIDKGSTNPTWTKLVAPLFNGTPEGCMSAERFFISFGTSSQILESSTTVILCHVGPCEPVGVLDLYYLI